MSDKMPWAPLNLEHHRVPPFFNRKVGVLCLWCFFSPPNIGNVSLNQICQVDIVNFCSKFGHQVKSLEWLISVGSIVGHQVAPQALPHCLGLPDWHHQFLLRCYLHQPESHHLSQHNVSYSEWQTSGDPEDLSLKTLTINDNHSDLAKRWHKSSYFIFLHHHIVRQKKLCFGWGVLEFEIYIYTCGMVYFVPCFFLVWVKM